MVQLRSEIVSAVSLVVVCKDVRMYRANVPLQPGQPSGLASSGT